MAIGKTLSAFAKRSRACSEINAKVVQILATVDVRPYLEKKAPACRQAGLTMGSIVKVIEG